VGVQEENNYQDDNIKIDLRKNWWDVTDWIHLAQDSHQWHAIVNTVTNIQSWKILR
jgi:hypothetical protein